MGKKGSRRERARDRRADSPVGPKKGNKDFYTFILLNVSRKSLAVKTETIPREQFFAGLYPPLSRDGANSPLFPAFAGEG
jgi:hypothetical protein